PERAEVLAALATVDHVVAFAEDTPLRLIELLEPDVLVKGADWAADEIVGSDVVVRRGGRVERVDQVPGVTTTELIPPSPAGARRQGPVCEAAPAMVAPGPLWRAHVQSAESSARSATT